MRKILFAVIALLGIQSAAWAQKAFQSLAFGIEAGTAGIGVELAMPLVTDHLFIRAGFNAPSIATTLDFDVSMAEVNSSIATVNSNLEAAGLPDRINTSFDDMKLNVTSTLNLSTVKAMLEYYPFRKSSFHITAGVFYGMEGSYLSATATTDKTFWSNYKSLQAEVDAINEKYRDVPGYTPADISTVNVNTDGQTLQVQEKDGAGYMEAAIDIPRLRPYLGLGFGRSVPRRRVGLQLDLGAIYMGAPSLSSGNEVAYDGDAQEVMPNGLTLDDFKFWPVASLRLTIRLF